MSSFTIRLDSVSKHYGETKALRDVSLEFQSGEVHALMGENGSGKSTLVKTISGIVQPTHGTVYLNDQAVKLPTPRAAIDAGIGTIHQDSAIVPSLTVAQNIVLGKEPQGWPGLLKGDPRTIARRWLEAIQADIDPDTVAEKLTVAGRQLVAIAKALSNESKLLIFDEPTAALGDAETEHLLTQIGSLRASGIGIVYISHRIAEVKRLADKMSVLKDGQLTYSGTGGLEEDEIIRLMIGREPDALFPELAPPRESIVLRGESLGTADGFLDVPEFTVRHGEVVGIAGLEGSGRNILARQIAGVERSESGRLFIEEDEIRRPTPSKSVRAGISFVPPERRNQAVIGEFSVAKSMTQSAVWKFTSVGIIRLREELKRAQAVRQEMGVKTETLHQSILTLSGGNQQKVVLARSLVAESKVMVCDEPTAGVDVGSRADIYGRFAELAEQGLGIVLSSSDMVELIGMCHRIVVIREGKISKIIPASEATEEVLLEAQLPT